MTPRRGEVYDVRFPSGRRPAVVVTRERVIPYLTSVTVVQVTSTIRGLPTEVPLGREHGLDHESVVNCDNLATVPKAALARHRGTLGPVELARLRDALRLAVELD
ncbi:MAG TPA: type II toxin-antitoxin system PemK/MazF family toxin [Actinomycetota bacterium]|nr:type II toxin-antitoxin system PemK/MazF family toxin [Actinomycetota bacterium]